MLRAAMWAVALACVHAAAPAAELPLWGGGKPACTQAGYQTSPVLVSDGAGGAIIAWVDYRSGSYEAGAGWSQGDIYAQRVDSDGNQLWQADGVPVCAAPGEQYGIRIVPDGAGGAIIAWDDGRGGSGTDIYAQRISASGTPMWTANGVPVSTAGGSQYWVTLTSDGSGGAVMAWTDTRRGFGFGDIYAQRISSSGAPLWTADGVAICTASTGPVPGGRGPATGPEIVQDGSGGWIIAWYDFRDGMWDPLSQDWKNCDIYAQKLSSSGAAAWVTNGVAVCTASGDQYMPVLVDDGAGGAIIAWNDGRVAQDLNIYAQRISGSGSTMWAANGVPVALEAHEQLLPAIVSDGSGGAVIAWEDYRTDSGGDIYAQRVSASGTTLWAPGGIQVAVTDARVEYGVSAARDPASGDAILAWNSWQESSKVDAFVQRLSLLGGRAWGYEGLPACDWPANQQHPRVAVGSTGPIVVWDDDRAYDPTSTRYVADIYVQRFGSPAIMGTISDARLAPTGSAVVLEAKVVTASFYDFFYIEEQDRSAGIKVASSGPAEGRLVRVTGVVEAVGGERQIRPTAAVEDLGPGVVPRPLGLASRGVGGAPIEVEGNVRVPGLGSGVGANNVGLLVTVYGRVGFVSDFFHPDGSHFYIDDGCALSDGSGNTGLRIIWDGSSLTGSPFVKVTGIASCTVPYGMTTCVPTIRPRSDGDIVIL